MGVLDDLERATQEAQKTKRTQQKEADKLAKMSEVERLIRAENSAPPGLDFSEVTAFYHHVLREPREILEARYEHLLGHPAPPKTRHEWLATRLGYHFQILFYQRIGEVPVGVARRAVEWALTWSHGKLGREHDADDPTDVEIWDDTYVVAAKPNPWKMNTSYKAFFAVEMGGERGTNFPTLCEILQRMCELAVPDAQDRALAFFTKSVREGLTKIRIE